MTADDPRHGSANAYNNLGCRCDACRVAQKDYYAKMLKTAHCVDCGKPIWDRPSRPARRCRKCAGIAARTAEHGTESKYKQGCRCADCRAATAAARRRRRHATIEATRAYDRERKRRQRVAA